MLVTESEFPRRQELDAKPSALSRRDYRRWRRRSEPPGTQLVHGNWLPS